MVKLVTERNRGSVYRYIGFRRRSVGMDEREGFVAEKGKGIIQLNFDFGKIEYHGSTCSYFSSA